MGRGVTNLYGGCFGLENVAAIGTLVGTPLKGHQTLFWLSIALSSIAKRSALTLAACVIAGAALWGADAVAAAIIADHYSLEVSDQVPSAFRHTGLGIFADERDTAGGEAGRDASVPAHPMTDVAAEIGKEALPVAEDDPPVLDGVPMIALPGNFAAFLTSTSADRIVDGSDGAPVGENEATAPTETDYFYILLSVAAVAAAGMPAVSVWLRRSARRRRVAASHRT